MAALKSETYSPLPPMFADPLLQSCYGMIAADLLKSGSDSLPSSGLTSLSSEPLVSAELTTREALPGPPNPPLIWSETRQELCESLAYYRSFQAGSYVKGGSHLPHLHPHSGSKDQQVAKSSSVLGYLLGGWPSKRDIWAHQGKVIISHGGGKNVTQEYDDPQGTKHKARTSLGGTTLKDDQSDQDLTIAALIFTMKSKSPVVLIAAENYALLSVKLNCGFAVMGWYIITDGWAEKETNPDLQSFVRWKFRFEWIEAQGQPWWIPNQSARPRSWNPRERTELFDKPLRRPYLQKQENQLKCARDRPRFAQAQEESRRGRQRKRLKTGPMHSSVAFLSTTNVMSGQNGSIALSRRICDSCSRPWPLVFESCWMCLHPHCSRFFVPSTPQDINAIQFSDDFLALRGDSVHGGFPGGRETFSMIPAWPSTDTTDQARGLWCPRCGRLSCRATIYRPLCAHCQHQLGPSEPLPRVSAPRSKSFHGHADASVTPSSGIQTVVTRKYGMIAYSFFFPKHLAEKCAVHLIQADIGRGYKEKEANRLFEQYQNCAWPSERSQSQSAQSSNTIQSSPKMSLNYVLNDPETWTSRDLIPFRRHPLANHMMKGQMLTQQFTCNYGVAYKHVVAMGTNPLDETSPAAITGSLELIKKRTAVVCPLKEGWFTSSTNQRLQKGFNELYPVLYMDHQKMSFHDDGEPGLGPVVSSLSLGGDAIMKFRVKAKYLFDPSGKKRHSIPEEGITDIATKDRVVLTLRLRHGSVCVQQGDNLQRKFEHMVQPSSFRVACTARMIDAHLNKFPPNRRP